MENQLLNLDLLTEHSWKQYKPKMGYYALIVLVSGLISFAAYTILIAVALLIGFQYLSPFADLFTGTPFWEIQSSAYIAAAAIIIPLIVALFIIGTWQSTVLWTAILSESEHGIGKSLKKSFSVFPRFFVMEFLRSLAITLGALLFLVPGILLAGWFLFSDIAIIKGARITESLEKSKQLVHGRWWAVVGRFIVITLAVVFIPNILASLPEFFGFAGDASGKPMLWITLAYVTAISILVTFFVDPWFKIFKKVLYDDAVRTAQHIETSDVQQISQS